MESRRAQGGLAQEVLVALAAADGPLTVGEVRAGLARDLAYTTVMTVLARLYEKGLVNRERAGRAYVYRVTDQAAVTAQRMQRLLDGDEDRAAVLTNFVGALTDEDERLLLSLLRQAGDEECP